MTAEPTDTPVAQPTPEPASASSGGSTTGAEALSDDDDDATPLPAPYDGARTGDGTYYGTTSGGNCGFKGDYPVKTDGYIPMAYSYGVSDYYVLRYGSSPTFHRSHSASIAIFFLLFISSVGCCTCRKGYFSCSMCLWAYHE